MTFTEIENGDDLDPVTAMENWRDTNYGNNLLPKDTTGAAVDATIDLGSGAAQYKDGYFSGNVIIAGLTIPQIVEANQLDSIATEQVLTNDFGDVTSLLNANFTKNSQDKILRITVSGDRGAETAVSYNIDSGTEIKVLDRAMGTDGKTFHEWFDISGLTNGSINITVASGSAGAGTGGTCKAYRNAF